MSKKRRIEQRRSDLGVINGNPAGFCHSDLRIKQWHYPQLHDSGRTPRINLRYIVDRAGKHPTYRAQGMYGLMVGVGLHI